MGILAETMLDPKVRGQVVADYARFIADQVAARKGPSGLMIKAAYKGLKGVKPGYIEEVVEVLLPSFMGILDEQHEEYLGTGVKKSFDAWVQGRSSIVADQLLSVTDEVVANADKAVVKKIYKGIRKIAQNHVAEAVPDMALVAMGYLAD